MKHNSKHSAVSAAALAEELAVPALLAATLSSPKDKASGLIRARIRRLSDSPPLWQIEEFRGQKAFHENVAPAALKHKLAETLGAVWTRAEFTLESGTVSVLANRRSELSALRKPAPRPAGEYGAAEPCETCIACETAAAGTAPAGTEIPANPTHPLMQPVTHNRAKRRILEEGVPVPFLVDLAVMTPAGAVIKSKYDKFRQINRYLEFVEDVLPALERRAYEPAAAETAADEPGTDGGSPRELTIVDFGCGKSYLTFAVYHYLVNLKGLKVKILGLDLKDDVIASCSLLARKYRYEGLSFSVGDIAGFRGLEKADMVMTLHACDTATDAALDQAVRWGAAVILSVPCCQHELNAQLGTNPAAGKPAGSAPAGTKTDAAAPAAAAYPAFSGRTLLEPAFRHGIIRERMAALLTDSFRAELLEAAGYKVQLLEFIDMVHTPKNLLIRAILKENRREAGLALSERYIALKTALGADPALERFLTSEER